MVAAPLAFAAYLPAMAGAQGAAKPLVNACALLTADDVSAVIGHKVSPGQRKDLGFIDSGAYSSTCLWVVPLAEGVQPDPKAPLGGASFAMLNAITWSGGAEDAKKYIQDFRDSANANLIDHTPVDVKVGDEGIWWGNGVAVRKGAVSFGISVNLSPSDAGVPRDMEETLARKIAERL